jgi:hypothetical protein
VKTSVQIALSLTEDQSLNPKIKSVDITSHFLFHLGYASRVATAPSGAVNDGWLLHQPHHENHSLY